VPGALRGAAMAQRKAELLKLETLERLAGLRTALVAEVNAATVGANHGAPGGSASGSGLSSRKHSF
jgi:ABC-type proline/glycine betaine transport system permease subunit